MDKYTITETSRFDWNALRAAGTAEGIPSALQALTSANTFDAASNAYWRVDNTAVVQGSLFQAAEATIPCALQALQICTAYARPKLLELLFQLGGGAGGADQSEIELGNHFLEDNCRAAVKSGLAIYFLILERGASEESGFAADLIELCAENDPSVSKRAQWWLETLIKQTTDTKLTKVYADCLHALEGLR